jgi:hypothetical protein
MFHSLKRRLCRHDFYWSERRFGHACYRCGDFRPDWLHPSPKTSPDVGRSETAAFEIPAVVCRARLQWRRLAIR